MKVLVTGAAGFIGSTLVDRLLSYGHNVIGVDNFSTGKTSFLKQALSMPNFKLVKCDLLEEDKLKTIFEDNELVFHLAANADVRFGTTNPRRDLEQNTIATFNVLEAMRVNNIKKIAFSSTGSIYGEASIFPTPENGFFPVQTSLYAASKLACEGSITAYCEGFDMQAWIFRFVSILGERYTHGHVFDFYQALRKNQKRLDVLGDGTQKKSYLYIQDCIDGMLLALSNSEDKVNILNLGFPGYCELSQSIKWICEELAVKPELKFSGGNRGWVGDNPFIFLDTKKIEALGWKPKISINEAVIKTLRYLKNNHDLMDQM